MAGISKEDQELLDIVVSMESALEDQHETGHMPISSLKGLSAYIHNHQKELSFAHAVVLSRAIRDKSVVKAMHLVEDAIMLHDEGVVVRLIIDLVKIGQMGSKFDNWVHDDDESWTTEALRNVLVAAQYDFVHGQTKTIDMLNTVKDTYVKSTQHGTMEIWVPTGTRDASTQTDECAPLEVVRQAATPPDTPAIANRPWSWSRFFGGKD